MLPPEAGNASHRKAQMLVQYSWLPIQFLPPKIILYNTLLCHFVHLATFADTKSSPVFSRLHEGGFLGWLIGERKSFLYISRNICRRLMVIYGNMASLYPLMSSSAPCGSHSFFAAVFPSPLSCRHQLKIFCFATARSKAHSGLRDWAV